MIRITMCSTRSARNNNERVGLYIYMYTCVCVYTFDDKHTVMVCALAETNNGKQQQTATAQPNTKVY